MKIECSWCKSPMGEKPPFEDTRTTHGICHECFIKMDGSNDQADTDEYEIKPELGEAGA